MKTFLRLYTIATVLTLLVCCASEPEVAPHLNSDEVAKIKLISGSGQPDEFTFIVMGDNRDGDDVFLAHIDEINNLPKKPLFIINSGDLVPNGMENEYRRFIRMITQSKYPFLVIPGNHDYAFKGEIGSGGKKHYLHYFGETYYYFDLWDFRFITLDNAKGNTPDDEQINWLSKLLGEGKKCFIFMHKPPPLWEAHTSNYNNMNNFLALIKKENNVLGAFFGHIHGFGEKEHNGIKFIVSGGGGAPLHEYVKDIEPVHHYLIVTVKKNGEWSYEVKRRAK